MKANLIFGNETRRRRHEKHFSQADLAERIGCSQTAISKIEAGELEALSGQKLKSLCHELGLQTPEGSTAGSILSYCGNPDCPLGWREVVNGKLSIQPVMFRIEADTSRFCKACGMPLLTQCQDVNCGAPPEEGAAFCTACGSPLVQLEKHHTAGDLEAYKQKMNHRCHEYRVESRNIEVLGSKEAERTGGKETLINKRDA